MYINIKVIKQTKKLLNLKERRKEEKRKEESVGKMSYTWDDVIVRGNEVYISS